MIILYILKKTNIYNLCVKSETVLSAAQTLSGAWTSTNPWNS